MNRRTFLAQAAGAVTLRSASGKRTNILWVSCEDTSPHIGCYGDKHSITPNIDRLAREGVRYSRAHAVAGVCAPSRSGIITGMYPSSLGSQYMRCTVALPDFVKCFPEYLRNAGYYCTNNAKTDYNFPVPKGAWDEVSRTAHWKNRKPDQPFFAVFNIETTHESQVRKRGADYDAMIKRLTPQQRQDPQKLDLPPYYPDTPESRRDWAQHYELITAMDYQVGDRIRELEQAGLLEDTIVFFWGDHGVGLPRAKRWLYESGTRVPLVIRVPEKIRTGAQAKPGSVDPRLLSLIDLGPTVLNLAGVPAPDYMQGQAFLGENLKPERQYVYAARDRMDETYDSVRMVRDRQYRYIRNYQPYQPYAQYLSYMEQGYVMKELRRAQREDRLPAAARLFMGETKPSEELYDVEADPHELQNLATSPGHKKILDRLRAMQEKWALETRATGLIPEPIVEDRGRKATARYHILRQPGSEKYLRDLRALVNAVNFGNNPKLVRDALSHSDPAFRYWAVIGLGKGVPATAAADPDPTVRIAALRAAATLLADDAAIPKLAAELKDPNPYVRLHAAQALEATGHRAVAARQALTKALEDENEYVKRVAEHTLAILSGG